MAEQPLDPRIERLIALLYGELPEEEERAMREEIDRDETLRAYWGELSGTRTILREWDLAETAPGFVFVKGPDARGAAPPAPSPLPAAAWRRRLSGILGASPWAIAVTATAVAVLAVGGFRVEKEDGALAFRFGAGRSDREQTAAPAVAQRSVPSGSLETLPVGRQPAVAGDENRYITRTEFDAYSSGMMRTLAAVLNEYARRRDQQVTDVLQTAFSGIAEKQNEDYRDLQGQLEVLKLGLSEDQVNTRMQIDYLMDQSEKGQEIPAHAAPATAPEGERK